jgi:transcription antitermination factor NusG
LAKKAIKLSYRSAERFSKDYALIKKGKIFLPSKTCLPLKTTLTLNITVPGIDTVFIVNGAVIQNIDEKTAAQFERPAGMLLAIIGGPDSILNELNSVLSSNAEYRNLLGLTAPAKLAQAGPAKDAVVLPPPSEIAAPPPESAAPPSGADADSHPTDDELFNELLQDKGDAELTLEWLRDAIAQEEVARDDTAAPEIKVAPTAEKKELTLAERKKIKPSGDFLMNLTKAMLRSGYYSSDHPGSKDAKKGLYENFQNCLSESREIMITKQEDREKTDILITGILAEPVNVRVLVGAGMADLFVPKLREYFKRKGLVSFALKNEITLEHFENFVDIMSDPKADSGENSKIGELLSNALAEHGITEISAVFMDDLIMLELNLPWRVEMAIQRLAKDLKMLPMFKAESDEKIKTLKLQIIQDIMRPLRHPQFLKDLIINCYIIAKHVDNVQTEDIEKVIIEAFPLNTLLPTSQFIFEELKSLRERHSEDSDNPALVRRVDGVKRILKWVVRRLVLADIRGAQSFLELLYVNQVLTFEELPPDVQYLVNTVKMAKDVEAHLPTYVYRILHAESADDAVVLLKLCRRVMRTLFDNNEWEMALLLTKAVDKAGKESEVYSKENGLSPNPQQFVFKNLTTDLVAAYEKVEAPYQKIIDQIAGRLGAQGIEILSKVLTDCEKRQVRKAATEALIKQGEMARRWVLKALKDHDQPWYIIRNALMILRFVGIGEQGIDRARQYMPHAHSRVRDEALHTLLSLKASDAEQLVITALDDPDEKVLWRATNALDELAPLSDASIAKLMEIIKTDLPEEKEAAAKQARKVSNIIRSLGTKVSIKNIQPIEQAILDIAQMINGQKKGIFQRIKKSSTPAHTTILSAAITTLGKMGTPKSEAFLNKPHRQTPPAMPPTASGCAMPNNKPQHLQMNRVYSPIFHTLSKIRRARQAPLKLF